MAQDLAPPRGVFVIVRDAGAAVGCGGLKSLDATVGEVKHMFVHSSHRGRGIGKQILLTLEDHARKLDMTRLLLDTNETLAEAIALYGRMGFVTIDRYNDNPYATHFFAKDL